MGNIPTSGFVSKPVVVDGNRRKSTKQPLNRSYVLRLCPSDWLPFCEREPEGGREPVSNFL